MVTRRDWLKLAAGTLAIGLPGALGALEAPPTIAVWKSPSCGCCKNWITHMEQNGFRVTVHDVANLEPIKRQHGVTASLASCHTGVINGYVIEGHVPADLVQRLLKERPRIAGLAVPGMPQGSPGMETGRKDAYDVIAWDARGRTSVFASR